MVKTEKKSKSGSRKKTSTRILKLVLALIVVLIVLVFFLVPAFVSSGKGRQIILAQINSSIVGQTDFADLSMGWFKGIKIADFSFNDSLGQISVQVKKITTKPHYGSIVMGNLSFGETTIDQPKVRVNLKAQPPAGYKRVGKPVPVPVKASYIALVMDVAINDGNLKVTDSKARTVELSEINSRLNLREAGRQTDFDIDLVVAGQKAERSPIHAAGQIKPGTAKSGWTLKGTTGDLTIEVNNLDLESLGPILELAKIEVQAKGSVSADINAVIKDGTLENLSGSVKAKNLDITWPKLKGDQLKTGLLDVVVKLKSRQQLVNIEQFQFDSDWLVGKASGMVPTTFKSWSDFLTSESDYSLDADFELDVEEVLSQMPHTFGIKEEMKVTSGKLSGNVTARRGSLTGQANLTELAGIVEDKKLALSEPVTAKVQISADNNTISFDELDISAAFAKINASGPLEKLKYDGHADLEKLQSELGQFVNLSAYKIAGEISEQGTLSFNKGKTTGFGFSQVKNLSITSTDGVTAQEPMAEVKFAFGFDWQTNVLTFDSFEANAGLGQVNIGQAILPIGEKPQVPMQLDISAKNIDLGKVKPFVVLFTSLPQETQLAGIAESKISVSSDKNIYKITTDATKITNLKLIYPGREPFEPNEVTLTFNAEVNTGQTDKLLTNLTAKAKLGFEKASYMGLNFGPTDVDIKIQNGLLKIAPFETTVNNGQFNFAGQVDFRQKPALLKIAEPMQLMKNIKIDDQTTEKLLRYLNPVFADAGNVSGIANFSCEQLIIPFNAAAQKQTEVVGTISIDQLSMQVSGWFAKILSIIGFDTSRAFFFTIRPMKFILRDGFLRYDDMQMDVGDNPFNFKGVIGLDKSLDMTITLPYTTRGRTARLGRETIGQRIPVPLKGTIDKPELDVRRLLEDQLLKQLEGQLEDQLRKGLEELFK